MTKVTGWDNGLSQDYDKGLGRWFANRLGARQQLRQDFEMTQHITQEQATQIAAQFAEDATYDLNIANAAIQHYLDQRNVELPLLPEPYFGSGRYLGAAGSRDAYTTTQIQTYGAACAAQARKLALSDAIKQVTILYEKDDYPVLTDICNLIATAK